MRILPLLLSLLLGAFASAQTTGRHFHRDERTPATPPTPAASPAGTAEASAKAPAAAPAPLQKLRSGRAWPSYHYRRLPANQAAPKDGPVDASSSSTNKPRRGFWGPRR